VNNHMLPESFERLPFSFLSRQWAKPISKNGNQRSEGEQPIHEKGGKHMIKTFWNEQTGKGVKPLSHVSSSRIRRRCSSCGLEWESNHCEETCPLRELESAFLPEDWFMMPSEAGN